MTQLVPAGARAEHVTTSAGDLHVWRAGEPKPGRAPIVLVHGGGSDAAAVSWFRLIEPLAHDRDVWAVDLPGFGESIDLEPVGGPDALAAIVAEVIDATGASRAIVMGVSMGGDVALNVALDYADRVSALVAIAPGGLTAQYRSRLAHTMAWWAAQWPDWITLLLARAASVFAPTSVRAMVHDVATVPRPVLDEFVRLARHRRGALGYLRYNQATLGRRGMTNDVSHRLRDLHVPTLFFHGSDDPLVNPDDSNRAANSAPNARLVLQAGCGHWAQLEAHDAFLAATRAFLRDVDA